MGDLRKGNIIIAKPALYVAEVFGTVELDGPRLAGSVQRYASSWQNIRINEGEVRH